jgi:hypothetical protein
MPGKLDYFGSANAFKVDVGEKSVSIHLERDEGFRLAEKILRAANDRVSIDIAIHKRKTDWRGCQISIVSRSAKAQPRRGGI